MSHPRERVTGVHLMMDMNASDLFESSRQDLFYCKRHASFQHKDAVEFMLYCGGELEDFYQNLKEMEELGCSQKLISRVKYARDVGALWLLLHGR